jgi:hypothetical protein
MNLPNARAVLTGQGYKCERDYQLSALPETLLTTFQKNYATIIIGISVEEVPAIHPFFYQIKV